jgi:hypothetical protein
METKEASHHLSTHLVPEENRTFLPLSQRERGDEGGLQTFMVFGDDTMMKDFK